MKNDNGNKRKLSKIKEFRKLEECYITLIKAANQYYDLVI